MTSLRGRAGTGTQLRFRKELWALREEAWVPTVPLRPQCPHVQTSSHSGDLFCASSLNEAVSAEDQKQGLVQPGSSCC